MNYRTQWSTISVPFTTSLANAETRFRINDVNDFVSVGLTVTDDKAGQIHFNSLQIIPAVNYNKSLEDPYGSYLSFGFSGAYIQRAVDMSLATFTSQYYNGGFSQYNPSGEKLSNQVINNWDLSTGVSLNSSALKNKSLTYYIGFAYYHITKPNQSFNEGAFVRLSPRWSANLGINYRINDVYSIIWHSNYTTQSPYSEVINGFLIEWRSLSINRFDIQAGVFDRLNDAIIPTIKIEYNNFSIVYSYDVTNSSLKVANSGFGGSEISVYYTGHYKHKTDIYKCPQFGDGASSIGSDNRY